MTFLRTHFKKISLATAATLVLGISVGAAVGLGSYTFVYANGSAYLTDDPAACANCHVMREQYSGWIRSSHHAVAGCNDCHTPRGFLAKYWTKAQNGYHHSLAFTTGDFHEPIRIKAKNLEIVEAACRGCHAPIVAQIDPHGGDRALACVRCHRDVGHAH